MKNKFLILILFVTLLSYSQSIERQVIGSVGTTLTDGTVSLDFTVGEVAVTTITDGTNIVSQGFHQTSVVLGVKINPIAFLQGALLNSPDNLMRDDLRELYVPLVSPYSDGLTCDVSVFADGGSSGTGLVEDNIVDWIWLELRDATDNTLVKASQSALLQRDGDIVDVDGLSNIEFPVVAKSYYVAVKHYNHLGIMTLNTVSLSDTLVTVDFTDGTNEITFGTNAQTTFGVPTNVVAMWAGDANGDGRLNYLGALSDVLSIRSQVLNDPDNSVFGGPPTASYPSEGYFSADVEMNGFTVYSGASSDVLYLRSNIFNHPSNSVFGGPPSAGYLFTQQLPEGGN